MTISFPERIEMQEIIYKYQDIAINRRFHQITRNFENGLT